jgi:MFS family permease
MRIYYGWVIVASCVVLLALLFGSSLGIRALYIIPVERDLNLSRSDINTGFALSGLGAAAIAPIVGRILDIMPVRGVMAIGGVTMGGGMIVLGLSHNIWVCACVLAVAVPIGTIAAGNVSATKLVTRWFKMHRARAMAITGMGMALGPVMLAPLMGWMIVSLRWRNCLMLTGVIMIAAYLLLLALLKERPGPSDLEPGFSGTVAAAERGPAHGRPLNTAHILRMPLFWALTFSMCFSMAAFGAAGVSLLPMAQQYGISMAASAGLISISGTTSVLGMLLVAWAGDRFERSATLAIGHVFLASVFVVLSVVKTLGPLLACVAIFGMISGATTPLLVALIGDCVGAPSFGAAIGLSSPPSAIASAVMLRITGQIYDSAGRYNPVFLTLAASMLFSSLMLLLYGLVSRTKLASASASTDVD